MLLSAWLYVVITVSDLLFIPSWWQYISARRWGIKCHFRPDWKQYPPQTPLQNDQAQSQLHNDLPTTPQVEKMEKILKQWLYKLKAVRVKAGRLAARLAMEVRKDIGRNLIIRYRPIHHFFIWCIQPSHLQVHSTGNCTEIVSSGSPQTRPCMSLV